MAPSAGSGVVPATDVLATLKRFDPDVEQVLASSGHVCLYTMAVESQQWTRKDVEGSLFLLKRRGSPRFQMMVLNKLSTENYVEDIHPGLDFELNPPYLMYTHGNSEIIGVWFYEQDDLHRVEDILKRIKQSQGSQAGQAAATQAPVRQPAGGKADDESFWDKPGPSAAAAAQSAAQPQSTAHRPSASAVLGDSSSSNLANLLRNAQLKQQQQQQQAAEPAPLASVPSAPLPQPLPPSFFAQQQPRTQQPQPLTTPPPPQPTVDATPSLPTVSPHTQPRPAQQRISQVLPAPTTAPDQAAAGGQLGGSLAKLFANAHKAQPAAGAQPVAAAPPPQLVAPAPAVALPAQAGNPPMPATPTGSSPASDEERVRRLLTRIATNDAFVKMLAAEMRAVGLL